MIHIASRGSVQRERDGERRFDSLAYEQSHRRSGASIPHLEPVHEGDELDRERAGIYAACEQSSISDPPSASRSRRGPSRSDRRSTRAGWPGSPASAERTQRG